MFRWFLSVGLVLLVACGSSDDSADNALDVVDPEIVGGDFVGVDSSDVPLMDLIEQDVPLGDLVGQDVPLKDLVEQDVVAEEPPVDSDGDGVPDEWDEWPLDPNWPGLAPYGYIYANTPDSLYAWNPSENEPIFLGDFIFPEDGADHNMTDIAVNRVGELYGITFEALYRCSAVNAECRFLARMSSEESFNGLTMIPRGLIDPDEEVMVAINSSGDWYRVYIDAEVASMEKLGTYGQGYYSAGDAYSIEGTGTFAAAAKQGSYDLGTVLIEVNPINGQFIREVNWISGAAIWGIAGVGDRIYAFDEDGSIYAGSLDDGSYTLVHRASVSWWGAGSTTRLKTR